MENEPRYKIGDRVWIKAPPRALNWRGQGGTLIGPTGPCWGVILMVGDKDDYYISAELDEDKSTRSVNGLWYDSDSIEDPFIQACIEALEDDTK